MFDLRRFIFAGAIALVTGCSGTSTGPAPVAPAGPSAAAPAAVAVRGVPATTGVGNTAHAATGATAVGAYVVSANAGMNVEGVVDYSVAQQFVDAVRQSRPWGNPATPFDEAVAQAGNVDANGWPTLDAGLLVLCCIAAAGSPADPGSESLLTGTYQLSFTGEATVGIPIGAAVSRTLRTMPRRTRARRK